MIDGPAAHYCSGRDCCPRGESQARDKAFDSTEALHFKHHVGYEPGRWLKFLKGLIDIGRMVIPFKTLQTTFDKYKFDKEMNELEFLSLSAEDRQNVINIIGVRVNQSRELLNSPMTRALLALDISVLKHLDFGMIELFKDAETFPAKETAEPKILTFMKVLHKTMSDFWKSLNGTAEGQPTVSHFDVVQALWPGEPSECLREIRTTCLSALSELEMRFLVKWRQTKFTFLRTYN